MTEQLAFFLAATVLLMTPGPTNTLLAASGAAAGFRRAAPLLAAEALGYAVAILAWRGALRPILAAQPGLEAGLQEAAALYLVYAALRLWAEGADPARRAEPAPFARVLWATLLNPKALLFALVVIPQGPDLSLPYGLALLALIPLIGGLWIGFGAAARANPSAPQLAKRLGAVALGGFAAAMAIQAFPA